MGYKAVVVEVAADCPVRVLPAGDWRVVALAVDWVGSAAHLRL